MHLQSYTFEGSNRSFNGNSQVTDMKNNEVCFSKDRFFNINDGVTTYVHSNYSAGYSRWIHFTKKKSTRKNVSGRLIVKSYRKFYVLVASLVLALASSACTTTPDLSGWAQNSAELAGVVKAESTNVLKRLDKNIAEMESGNKEGWNLAATGAETEILMSDWRHWRKSYKASSETIDAGMTAMTLYADSLAKLAAAGETGKEAVGKISNSLTDIGNLIGVTFPAAPAVVKVVEEIAEIWTKVEAQNSLAEAMALTDPKVSELAALIEQAATAQIAIVARVNAFERKLIRLAAGPSRMAWYVKNQSYQKNEQAFSRATNSRDDTVLAAVNTYLIEALEPKFRERAERRAEVKQWVKTRKQALAAIASSASEWQKTHTDATNLLVSCGGFRFFKSACGSYTAANLKLAAGRIKEVVAATETESED